MCTARPPSLSPPPLPSVCFFAGCFLLPTHIPARHRNALVACEPTLSRFLFDQFVTNGLVFCVFFFCSSLMLPFFPPQVNVKGTIIFVFPRDLSFIPAKQVLFTLQKSSEAKGGELGSINSHIPYPACILSKSVLAPPFFSFSYVLRVKYRTLLLLSLCCGVAFFFFFFFARLVSSCVLIGVSTLSGLVSCLPTALISVVVYGGLRGHVSSCGCGWGVGFRVCNST